MGDPGQLGHHDLWRLVRHRPHGPADSLDRGESEEHAFEQRGLAGEQAVEGRPRHARAGGELVHRQLGEPAVADHLEPGGQDPLLGAELRIQAKSLEQGGPRLELPVETRLGRSRGGRDLGHGGPVARAEEVAGAGEDALAPGCLDRHEAILDKTSRLVKSRQQCINRQRSRG